MLSTPVHSRMGNPALQLPSDRSTRNTAALLEIEGELTLVQVAGFREKALESLLNASRLTLSFAKAEYLDAAALQCLFALQLEARIRGIPLSFVQIPDAIRKDASLMGLGAALSNVDGEEVI